MSIRGDSIEVKLGVEVDPQVFGRYLEALCGIFPPAPLDPDLARWEDDGGPPAPDPINYTHTMLPPDDPGFTGPWWVTYRFEGGERVPTQHTGPPAADPPTSPVLEEWQHDTLSRLFERRGDRYVFKRWQP